MYIHRINSQKWKCLARVCTFSVFITIIKLDSMNFTWIYILKYTIREFKIYHHSYKNVGFPDSSVSKEYACNAGDPGSIPGLGRSAGQRIGYPLQYSWASLVAQLVKNLPAMWETWVRSLDWEDPLRRERLPTPVCCLENSTDSIVYGITKNQTRLSEFHFTLQKCILLIWSSCFKM